MILFFISFIAGLLTVLAPCVLPLLPVIVGGSMTDGKVNIRKALTVVLSLGISVIAFTFLLKVSTLFINIPPYTWTLISGGIVLILGIVTLFPSLWEGQFMARLSAKSNILLGKGDQKKSFWGDVIVGAALGPVFSTCSPTYFIVIATVLPVSPTIGVVYLLSYTVGLCLTLLLVAFIGQKIMDKLGAASDSRGILKRVLGIIFIIVGVAILTGADKKLESAITDAGFFDVTKIEQALLQKDTSLGTPSSATTSGADILNTEMATSDAGGTPVLLTLAQKAAMYQKAPELASIDGYINTDGQPITLASLKGKVVLIDFWTYSCINCQRTLPYINAWYGKYKDQGLVVIGVHTPEFSFEKVQSNVQEAVTKLGIQYPVVLDNEYGTWQAFGNSYWPREYLIDMDGFIVHDHIGEGDYDQTEKAIQAALKERADRLGVKEAIPSTIATPTNAIAFDADKVASPETYFGSDRNQYIGNATMSVPGTQDLTLPSTFDPNELYLGGTWNFTPEYATNTTAATAVFKYQAKNVYMVASSDAGVDVGVYEDGVFVKTIHVKDQQLYTLIEGTDYGTHTIELKIPTGSLNAFTFTFG
jgi:cytochrome c biogenesis protein CcdA/thiol-disulfide isomerase/thioredoxin